MKTRPYIVTARRLMDTAGFYRVADALAARMGRQGRVRDVIRTAGLLLKVMGMIVDITLRNTCFTRRQAVLESPVLRARLLEQLGGAPAAQRWRRQHIWNKSREACIASGKVADPRAQAWPKPAHARPNVQTQIKAQASAQFAALDGGAAALSTFRFPPLRHWHRIGRPHVYAGSRAAPSPRYPSIVIWPHELDGQYVPEFQSRCVRPGSEHMAAGHMAAGDGLAWPVSIRPAPPAPP